MASRRGQMIDGVLLLDKPADLSSNQALQRARRALDARKAGHAGTLDPFATGLLVCCLGKATKLAGRLLDADKTYIATLKFGVETDSGDLTGVPVAPADPDFAGISPEQLQAVLPEFRGDILQVPPMHSALKHEGKPLYHYARKGIEIERPARSVTIHSLDVIAQTPTEAVLSVHCSKGTYIRTLAQDIGRRIGCGAHLVALRRSRVGPFDIQAAISLDALQTMDGPLSQVIALEDLPPELAPAAI